MEKTGAKLIPSGCTKDLISLGRTEKGVFVLSFLAVQGVNPENRWNYEFTLGVHVAFDAIENELENDKPGMLAFIRKYNIIYNEFCFKNKEYQIASEEFHGCDDTTDLNTRLHLNESRRQYHNICNIQFVNILILKSQRVLTCSAGTPASLVVISESPKFFSNGIDTTLLSNSSKNKVDMNHFNKLAMPAFTRPMLLPIPTIAVINGHCFGAGFMFALGFDYRMQKKERGYISANEVLIGAQTPGPELTLFRSSMRVDEFHQSMLFGKRWNAEEAKISGIVQEICPGDELLDTAMKKATELSKLGMKRHVMDYYKRQLKGYVVEEVLCYCFQEDDKNGKPLPPGLRKHVDAIVHGQSLQKTWGKRHRDLEYYQGTKHSMMGPNKYIGKL